MTNLNLVFWKTVKVTVGLEQRKISFQDISLLLPVPDWIFLHD